VSRPDACPASGNGRHFVGELNTAGVPVCARCRDILTMSQWRASDPDPVPTRAPTRGPARPFWAVARLDNLSRFSDDQLLDELARRGRVLAEGGAA